MKRIEIIANRSVQEEITTRLETAIDGFAYTLIPVVQGVTPERRRLGDATWPEENFILFAYVKDSIVPLVEEVIAVVKNNFPAEGIKLFTTESCSSFQD
ncbi:PG0541 family transporter-associated protein [Treponema sp. J25]|uniref:PG0541 family transporter-associated protein n=1 Tax=Treponema sp. J25 TaxID=2094121 RepID=UPI00104E2227|nr:PG0541 family transporter-associated protein [Treponema sp. J25]TCW60478.1 hypothetical protein C5O22_11390 [Treponema sp. J25]